MVSPLAGVGSDNTILRTRFKGPNMSETVEARDLPCIVHLEKCYCEAPLKPLVSAPFFVRWHDGNRVNLPTILYYCKSCDFGIRGLDYNDPMVATHYELTGYTDPQREEHWCEKRRIFFNWFNSLAIKHLGGPPRSVLDFGCSFGHLLDIFADNGAETLGVEVAPQLLEKLKKERRHRIYQTIKDPEIPDDSIDVITAIDSIYYCGVPKPADLFAIFARKLRSGGILITRTTNRNQIYKIYALRWHLLHGRFDKPAPIAHRVCGDGMFNFSERAILKYLEPTGLKKVATYRWEHKRKRPGERLRDVIALAVYYVSRGRLDVCPGLVLVARK